MVVQMMVEKDDDGVGVGGDQDGSKKLPLIGLSPSILPSAMNLKGLGNILSWKQNRSL